MAIFRFISIRGGNVFSVIWLSLALAMLYTSRIWWRAMLHNGRTIGAYSLLTLLALTSSTPSVVMPNKVVTTSLAWPRSPAVFICAAIS